MFLQVCHLANQKSCFLRVRTWSYTSSSEPQECFTQACAHTLFVRSVYAAFSGQSPLCYIILRLSDPSHFPNCSELRAASQQSPQMYASCYLHSSRSKHLIISSFKVGAISPAVFVNPYSSFSAIPEFPYGTFPVQYTSLLEQTFHSFWFLLWGVEGHAAFLPLIFHLVLPGLRVLLVPQSLAHLPKGGRNPGLMFTQGGK